jgi:mannose-6-phosphate isomerase
MTKEEFLLLCKEQKLDEVMNVIYPEKGDFLFIEPGTIHSATGGVLIAEVQQSSDITYRVYDWGREHNPETAREMHLELALDCINFNKLNLDERIYKRGFNSDEEKIILNDSEYFKVDKIKIKSRSKITLSDYERFIIYLCLEGDAVISSEGGSEVISTGETILIPASLEYLYIDKLTERTTLLEITGK